MGIWNRMAAYAGSVCIHRNHIQFRVFAYGAAFSPVVQRAHTVCRRARLE